MMGKASAGIGRIALRLEIDPDSEPIAVRLIDSDGEVEEFRGWLAFAAAIERLTRTEDRIEA